MTRDEEIITACKSFLSRYPSIDQAGLSIGFLDGAVWADKHPNLASLWHDASEEPQSGIEMLIEYENQWGTYKYHGTFYLHKDSEVRWKELCEEQKVIRWAYISDLLPKQFGNSERLKGEHNGNND